MLTKFRPKDTNLYWLHYQVSTNLGLIQSSMSYLYGKRGSAYHWALDLYRRIGLAELDGMREIVSLLMYIALHFYGAFPFFVFSVSKTMRLE